MGENIQEYIKSEGARFIASIMKEVEKQKFPVVPLMDNTRVLRVLQDYENVAKTKATTPQELRIILNITEDLRLEFSKLQGGFR